jgi:hypothetical protein
MIIITILEKFSNIGLDEKGKTKENRSLCSAKKKNHATYV